MFKRKVKDNRENSSPIFNTTILLVFIGLVLTALGFLNIISAEEVKRFIQDKRNSIKDPITSKESEKPEEEPPSVFGAKLDPIYEVPNSLYATKKESDKKLIDVKVIKVGVETDGQLEAPEKWNEAGWYTGSAMVGEEGNTIINGHYDNNYGQPAAFYNLKSLEVNDKVYLVDSFGRTFAYQITENFYVGINDEDRIERLMESNGATLTLVTCGGVWDFSENTYNNRLVVKAKRAE